MRRSLAQLRVWINCPQCGAYRKLQREAVLPLKVVTPMFEKTDAVCDRCHALAVMCFERRAILWH
jgi:hypothetical protein